MFLEMVSYWSKFLRVVEIERADGWTIPYVCFWLCNTAMETSYAGIAAAAYWHQLNLKALHARVAVGKTTFLFRRTQIFSQNCNNHKQHPGMCKQFSITPRIRYGRADHMKTKAFVTLTKLHV